MKENTMYEKHEMDSVAFDETDVIVRTLSGDEDNTGGSQEKSDW